MRAIFVYALAGLGVLTAVAETVPLMWAIPGHGGAVPGVAVSPDGHWVATGSDDATVKLWRAGDGRLVWSAATQFGGARVTFSPDSQTLYVGTIGGAAGWSVRDRAELGLVGNLETGVAVDVSRDGLFIAVGGSQTGSDDSVRVIRISDGLIVSAFDINTPQYNFSVRFSADGTRLFAGSGNIFSSQTGIGKLRLWDLQTQSLVSEIDAHISRVSGLALSSDGKLLASVGGGGAIRFWNAANLAPVRTILTQATSTYDIAFSPDDTRVAAGQSDGRLRTWDVTTGALLTETVAHAGVVGAVAWSPSGAEIYSASGTFLETPQSADNSVRAWDAETLAPARSLTRITSQLNFTDTAGAAGRLVLAVDRGINVLRISDQASLRTITANGFVNDCAISADGARVAMLDGTVARVHDVATGALLRSIDGPATPFTLTFSKIALSPTGGHVAIVSRDRLVRVWDVASGTLLTTFTPPGFGTADLAYSPDGVEILTGGAGAYLWDAATGALVRNLPIGSNAVTDVNFSPDGARLVAGTSDGAVKVWNRSDGSLLTNLATGLGWVTAVALSADGSMVAAAKRIDPFLGGPKILIWEIASGIQLSVLDNESPSAGVGLDFIHGDRQLLQTRTDGTIVALENPLRGRSGDLNCDGVVSVSDIGGFVLSLTDPAAYAATFPGCPAANADVNADGAASVSDIARFVERLIE